jgi:hypothetical protein
VIAVLHDLEHVRQEYPETLLLARESSPAATPPACSATPTCSAPASSPKDAATMRTPRSVTPTGMVHERNAVVVPLLSPFIEFGFMRRALAGCLALSLGATPVGVFLMLRRMSLAGDAMSHAILPGAAIGYLIAGLSLPAMTLGGLVAGLAVAVLAGGVARNTVIKEDTSLATFYLLSLSAGVLIISLRGSSVDLLHVLFGSVLALDDAALLLLAGFASLSVVALASACACSSSKAATRLSWRASAASRRWPTMASWSCWCSTWSPASMRSAR